MISAHSSLLPLITENPREQRVSQRSRGYVVVVLPILEVEDFIQRHYWIVGCKSVVQPVCHTQHSLPPFQCRQLMAHSPILIIYMVTSCIGIAQCPQVIYGVRSPKFIWAPCAQLFHWLRPLNNPPPSPPHLGSYTRALLVRQDRRHLFVTPWLCPYYCTLWQRGIGQSHLFF